MRSVEVSFDDVVITKIKNKVEVWCKIGGTAGDTGELNVMNLDGDIVEDGCNGEVLCVGVGGEERVGMDVGEGDGVIYVGDKSSTTCVT